MSNTDIKILDRLSINQNIICLVISYIGVVYIAQLDVNDKCLCCLVNFIGCLCTILLFICILSVVSSMIAYAIEYWKKKWYKGKGYQLEYKNKESNKTGVNCKRCAKCPCKACEL